MERDIIMSSEGYESLDKFSKCISEAVEKVKEEEAKKGNRHFATHSGIVATWNPETKKTVVFAQRVLYIETPEEAKFVKEYEQKSIAEANQASQKAGRGAFDKPSDATNDSTTKKEYKPKQDHQGRIEVGAAWRDQKEKGMLSVKRVGGGYFAIKETDLALLDGELTFTNKETGIKTYWQLVNSNNPKAPIYRVFADGGK